MTAQPVRQKLVRRFKLRSGIPGRSACVSLGFLQRFLVIVEPVHRFFVLCEERKSPKQQDACEQDLERTQRVSHTSLW